MKLTGSITFGGLVLLLTACGPNISNDNKIGNEEMNTYQQLMGDLTKKMKAQFGGSEAQNDKISPSETADEVTIAIPNSVGYTFAKNNSKFCKGDLNSDGKWDLIIKASFQEAYGSENYSYFVYLQKEKGYELFAELKADEMPSDYADKMKFKKGLFVLDSISGGYMIGSSKYRKGDESYFRDYSYKVATEKFKLNEMTKFIKLVTQSDLLKKNPTTDEYEKVPTEGPVKK